MDRFKASARVLRGAQTSAEAKLWQALRARQLASWKFRRQHAIEKYIVDFVTLSGRLIVEVDGVTHASADELARDAFRTAVLARCGFHLVRVTNTDVYDNLDGVLEMIAATLRGEWRPLTRRKDAATSPQRGEVKQELHSPLPVGEKTNKHAVVSPLPVGERSSGGAQRGRAGEGAATNAAPGLTSRPAGYPPPAGCPCRRGRTN